MQIWGGKMLEIMMQNMVDIPLIQPIVDALLKIPVINYIVALILWRPIFGVLIIPGLGAIMLVLMIIVWWERKLTARVQWRVGPLEVSRPIGGVMQAMADGMRYFFQEVIVHRNAHAIYFIQLPILAFLPVLLPILLIPAGTVYAIRSDYAIPAIVALIALIPVVIIAMGWASNNRFAYIGAVREAFMYFAYEIPLMFAVLAMMILYGSGDPFVIVEKQTIPGIFLNPVAALTFIITTVMATSRLPFEIPEADQEIAFGPFVEYSGILFGLVMTLAYEKLYLMSLLLTILFLGGWNGIAIPILGDFMPPFWLFLKAFIFMLVVSLLRSIYARYRLDQALKIGWSSILALSIISIAISYAFVSTGWLP